MTTADLPHAPTPPAPAHAHTASPNDWWRRAVLATVGGIGVGVTVVLAVLALMALSPSLKAAGVDAGLAVANRINMATSTKLGLSAREAQLGIRGYVFIDLDAGKVLREHPGRAASAVACEAMGRTGSAASAAAAPAALACGDNRDTNRLLLAEVLALVYAHKPRAVVVDVELSSSAYGVQPAEDTRLKQVFAANQHVPTFFVLPVEPAAAGAGGGPASARLRLLEAPYAGSARVVGLPVLMTPGLPARSFPDCYAVLDPGAASERRVMNIPRAVVSSAAGPPPPAALATDCDEAAPAAARIVYTLASSNVDVDRSTYAAQQAPLVELQSKLNGLYSRCLASKMWDVRSACSTSDFFEDKILVLGNSAPYRGDWHYTPLGEMPGSLILVNAIRSAALYGEAHAKNPVYAVAFKLGVMLLCSVVWLMFWLQHYARRRAGPVLGARQARRTTIDALMLLATVLAVVAIAYSLGFSPAGPDHSLDALLPGLTVGIEVFIEIVTRFVKWLEDRFAYAFGWEGLH